MIREQMKSYISTTCDCCEKELEYLDKCYCSNCYCTPGTKVERREELENDIKTIQYQLDKLAQVLGLLLEEVRK